LGFINDVDVSNGASACRGEKRGSHLFKSGGRVAIGRHAKFRGALP
jgi:hypothetical protein